MAQIVSYIKCKMEEEGLTAYALEKRAGLKPSAVNNIIYGKSKNPSIEILKAIAKALNCSVSDLIGERVTNFTQSIEHETAIRRVNTIHVTNLESFSNNELYTNCLHTVAKLLHKKKIFIGKEEIISCIDEIYLYSTKKNFKNQVDQHFAEWILDKYANA